MSLLDASTTSGTSPERSSGWTFCMIWRPCHSTSTSIPVSAVKSSIASCRISACGSPCSHWDQRSEEHTSELQSRGHLVCRLLLEKKNHNTRTQTTGQV